MEIPDVATLVHPKLLESLQQRFKSFNPPQVDAIKKGLFDNRNMVVSAPTASGKTLIAEMACINNILNGRGKAVYIVPLKSLASEKYSGFKEHYSVRTAISVGDLDSSEGWLDRYDIIVTTSEKMDSLLRHRVRWINDVATVVIDEAHMITDPSRGPTLEVLYTRLKHILPKAQYIALSATISNDEELAEWMDAELVRSSYRPVELHKGVYYSGELHLGKKKVQIEADMDRPEAELVSDTLKKGKQLLFFLSSRLYAEALAKNLSGVVSKSLDDSGREGLRQLSEHVLDALEHPTSQCRSLASCIRNGVAFHHAGLVSKQRQLIEEHFRNGDIRCICATPTLAMGVNLPSFRVVVRDLKRYTETGLEWIPVLEYHQMAGRAGRPSYDEYGEAICLARTEGDIEEIFDRYILAEPEAIVSKLAVEPVLRMHTLALIADHFIRDMAEAEAFFKKTFWAHQYERHDDLLRQIADVVDLLIDWGFVKKTGSRLIATRIGRRVSELYIDPASAHYLIENMGRSAEAKTESLSFLHLICRTGEMRPLLRIKPSDYTRFETELAKYEHLLIEPEPSPFDLEYEEYLNALKTALMFQDWIDEMPEGKRENKLGILEVYRVAPGTLRQRLLNADWMLYAAAELCRLLRIKKLEELNSLRLRVKYGIKAELVDLVRLRGIGRVRARMLYNRGIRTAADVRAATLARLSSILGAKVAENVKAQLNEAKSY